MIKWENGVPKEVLPGMLLHYLDGSTFLVGGDEVYPLKQIRRYCQVVPTYWLEWADSMANHIGHQS